MCYQYHLHILDVHNSWGFQASLFDTTTASQWVLAPLIKYLTWIRGLIPTKILGIVPFPERPGENSGRGGRETEFLCLRGSLNLNTHVKVNTNMTSHERVHNSWGFQASLFGTTTASQWVLAPLIKYLTWIRRLIPLPVTHHLGRTFPAALLDLTGVLLTFPKERCSLRDWISL